MTNRELDKLVAKLVFLQECVHKQEYVPLEYLIIEAEREFEKAYGQKPPPKWAEEEAYNLFNSDYPPVWCKYCHSTSQEIQQYVPYYSVDMKYAWRIVVLFRMGWNGRAAATIELTVSDSNMPDGDCSCIIYGPDIELVEATSTQMAKAICLAAVKVAENNG